MAKFKMNVKNISFLCFLDLKLFEGLCTILNISSKRVDTTAFPQKKKKKMQTILKIPDINLLATL